METIPGGMFLCGSYRTSEDDQKSRILSNGKASGFGLILQMTRTNIDFDIIDFERTQVTDDDFVHFRCRLIPIDSHNDGVFWNLYRTKIKRHKIYKKTFKSMGFSIQWNRPNWEIHFEGKIPNYESTKTEVLEYLNRPVEEHHYRYCQGKQLKYALIYAPLMTF